VGVSGLLARAGAARPHVLVAVMLGGAAVRLAAEEQLRHRGWPAALSPADADVLLVAGAPAADIAASVQATWAAVPAPRVRALVTRPGEVAAALDAAQAELATGAPRWLFGKSVSKITTPGVIDRCCCRRATRRHSLIGHGR
jgi:hypothetical protein